MLGDALGSLGIILSALAIRYGEPYMGRYRLLGTVLGGLLLAAAAARVGHGWTAPILYTSYPDTTEQTHKNTADPLMSFIIVGIIIATTLPVLRQSARILLNFTPKGT